MKLRTVLPMLAVATFALAACASKVDYAKFHDKAVEAAKKEAGYTKLTVKGNVKYSEGGATTEIKLDHQYEKNGNSWELKKGEKGYMFDIVIGIVTMMRAENVPESKDYEYYAGTTFKVVMKDGDDKATVTFDKFGYPTSEKGKTDQGDLDVTAKWSK